MISVLAALALFAAPSDSTEAPASRGPLEPGSIGLGFRVLGDAPEVLARYALSPRWSIGLAASGSGSYISHEETAQERTYSVLRVALPFEVIPACRGNVCATVGFGPLYKLFNRYSREDSYYQTGYSQAETSSTSHAFGLTSSLGARWEFVPGFSLAASWGVDAYGIVAEDEFKKNGSTFYPDEKSGGFGATTWNGGIGLDAWF